MRPQQHLNPFLQNLPLYVVLGFGLSITALYYSTGLQDLLHDLLQIILADFDRWIQYSAKVH